MNEEDEEKVCLTKAQMDNILDADREYVTGGKRPKKACPKAWDWVTKYRPLKQKKDPDIVKKVAGKVERKIIRSIKEKLGALGDFF